MVSALRRGQTTQDLPHAWLSCSQIPERKIFFFIFLQPNIGWFTCSLHILQMKESEMQLIFTKKKSRNSPDWLIQQMTTVQMWFLHDILQIKILFSKTTYNSYLIIPYNKEVKQNGCIGIITFSTSFTDLIWKIQTWRLSFMHQDIIDWHPHPCSPWCMTANTCYT